MSLWNVEDIKFISYSSPILIQQFWESMGHITSQSVPLVVTFISSPIRIQPALWRRKQHQFWQHYKAVNHTNNIYAPYATNWPKLEKSHVTKIKWLWYILLIIIIILGTHQGSFYFYCSVYYIKKQAYHSFNVMGLENCLLFWVVWYIMTPRAERKQRMHAWSQKIFLFALWYTIIVLTEGNVTIVVYCAR